MREPCGNQRIFLSTVGNLTLFPSARLPDKIGYAPVAQYRRSFLIVGGNDESDTILDTVLWYTAEGEWKRLPTKMKTPRYRHTALLVTEC